MVSIKHNSLKPDIFLILYLFQVFQGPGFSESRFFRVKGFQGPDFSGSGSRVKVFQGPGPGSGSSFQKQPLLKLIKRMRPELSHLLFLLLQFNILIKQNVSMFHIISELTLIYLSLQFPCSFHQKNSLLFLFYLAFLHFLYL